MTDLEIAKYRRDKNGYYLSVAKTIAFGSKCPEGKQHGAIAVKNSRMISTGYNGPASGMPHCGKNGEECFLEVWKAEHDGEKNLAICPAVHAEINVIVTAAQIGTALSGSMFYITKKPCNDCLKALRNLNLVGVVYPQDEDEDDGTQYLLLGPDLRKEIELYA